MHMDSATMTQPEMAMTKFSLIQLSDELVTLVDSDHYEKLNSWNWCATENDRGKYYAHRRVRDETGKNWNIYMQRFLLDAGPGMYVDHINGNTLDNRMQNLRFCTPSQNGANRRKSSGTSKYKGVFWNSQRSVWQAALKTGGRRYYLGSFLVEEDAASAYDAKALATWGEFALLNLAQGAVQTTTNVPTIEEIIRSL